MTPSGQPPERLPSIEHRLQRIRGSSVRIAYEILMDPSPEEIELPFVVGVLADLSGLAARRRALRHRRFREIGRDNFEALLEGFAPRLAFAVDDPLSGGRLDVDLAFRRFDDFEPTAVAAQVGPLRCSPADWSAKHSLLLSAVLHHPDFQRLEATWRGLHYLVHESETGPLLKIRILDVRKDELFADLARAADLERSELHRLISCEEFGTLGGQPYGLLLGYYEFGRAADDVALLGLLALIAERSHAPFVAAAAPGLLGLRRFTELANHPPTCDGIEWEFWQAFRHAPASSHVALTLPRVLARLPYGRGGTQAQELPFEERVGSHDDYLWMNAAWAWTVRVTDAFARHGWFATISGVENGGKVEGLPLRDLSSTDTAPAEQSSMEIAFSERVGYELGSQGLLPLVQSKHGAVFMNTRSCREVRLLDTTEETARAEFSAQLNVLLCASRFAHYLKKLVPEGIESFMEIEDFELSLNRWLSQYVFSGDLATVERYQLARTPLREARVAIREIADRPGRFRLVTHLRPLYQLDEVPTSVRLVVEVPRLS
jgi:type VI secretion system protein ImpC